MFIFIEKQDDVDDGYINISIEALINSYIRTDRCTDSHANRNRQPRSHKPHFPHFFLLSAAGSCTRVAARARTKSSEHAAVETKLAISLGEQLDNNDIICDGAWPGRDERAHGQSETSCSNSWCKSVATFLWSLRTKECLFAQISAFIAVVFMSFNAIIINLVVTSFSGSCAFFFAHL